MFGGVHWWSDEKSWFIFPAVVGNKNLVTSCLVYVLDPDSSSASETLKNREQDEWRTRITRSLALSTVDCTTEWTAFYISVSFIADSLSVSPVARRGQVLLFHCVNK